MKYKFIKKSIFLLVLITSLTLFIIQPVHINAAENLDITAESAILVDADTGKVLYAKNPDIALPPASMTKMMTEYLVWDAIKKGDITWETTTEISDYPYQISSNPTFSGIGLTQNRKYTVKSLYEAMAINSDNATSIALAELIAGSEGKFVKMMNEKGKEMGLPDFRFVNSTGLENESLGDNYPEGTDPDGINLLSARSAVLLAYHLINDFPDALEISNIPQTEFDGVTITNYNWMLKHDVPHLKPYFYEGVDGLKTGNTKLAGYCFTGTAERSGQRLIMAIMRTENENIRFKETAEIFDYGYKNFKSTELFQDGYQLKDQKMLEVINGKSKTVQIALKNNFKLPIKADQKDNYTVEYNVNEKLLNKDGKLTAPIKKGDKIGTVTLINTDEVDPGYITLDHDNNVHDLVAIENVEEDNWFMIKLESAGTFFVDFFTSIVNSVKDWF